jgi:SAM-dependent methyltransferase
MGAGIRGAVLDVGCGAAWTSAILSRRPGVTTITGLDFSHHRLHTIAPLVFTQFDADESKFFPLCSDFRHPPFGAHRFDAIVFCQSLYMFPEIHQTLSHCRQLMAPGGALFIACERITPPAKALSPRDLLDRLRQALRGRADATGNHQYTDSEYHGAIRDAGFAYQFQALDYTLYPKGRINAGNHIGVALPFRKEPSP